MANYIEYDMIKKISIKKQNCYFIIEEDFFLSNEIQKIILTQYKKETYHIIKIHIKLHVDWNMVYHEYQQTELFFKKKVLIITIDKNKCNHETIFHIKNIIQQKNKEIIFILHYINFSYKHDIIFFKNIIGSNQIIINCRYLNIKKTKLWIQKIILNMKINLTEDIIDLLSNFYEKNLLMLFKMLQVLKIINTNKNLTKKYIKNISVNHIQFNINHWIYELFSNHKLQAIKILNYFKKNKYKILYLLQAIKINLIYLIHMKLNYIDQNYFHKHQKKIIFFEKKLKYKIHIKHINYKKIYKIINFLQKIDIYYKTFHHQLLWEKLKILIIIF
ncbi:DNA polymerase III subunit delta [Buchnera aphidicola]|uniref:DNA-directed DNA polymerase n=1 Tax=Buchnera aphidicola (Sarucallis kahawaluokalani) TaxID=1241878 RepID=A0A4D6YK62_9GAMM|nr:DNA polymerase III subunit delta [Buchnera aphidicola]QCI26078.1 DNA polymerase III subunit delta [Buchnera aphidicola (Sarucallis kahawaluokalani)]